MTFSKNFIAFGIILALFPYLKVPVANFDTAPYALIFFTLILLLRWNTVLFPKIFLVFLFPSLLGIMLVLPTLAGLDLLVFRSVMGYLSVILISFGTPIRMNPPQQKNSWILLEGDLRDQAHMMCGNIRTQLYKPVGLRRG